MRFFFHSKWLVSTGRVFAMLAMCVLLVGQAVHLHQECDGCHSASCCSTSAKAQSKKPDSPKQHFSKCPAGCTHHLTHTAAASQEDEPSSGENPPPHDEHNCAVCSQLAQAPTCPVLIGLPVEADIVLETISLSSDTAIAGTVAAAQSRGPPQSA